jgi:hypothetical protein
MTERDRILATEYSEKFDELRKNRMVMSFYKYGALKTNAGEKLVDEIASLELRVEEYRKTGNLEFLADVANFAMIEFMQPQHPNAHFVATDSNASPGLVGMSIKEVERFKEDEAV